MITINRSVWTWAMLYGMVCPRYAQPFSPCDVVIDLPVQEAVGFEIKRKFVSNCEDFARAVYEEQRKMFVFSFDNEHYDRVLKCVGSILALEAGKAVPRKRMVSDYTSFP